MNHSSDHHVLCLSLPDNNVIFTTNINLLFYDSNKKAIYTDEGNLMVAIAITAKVYRVYFYNLADNKRLQVQDTITQIYWSSRVFAGIYIHQFK